MTPRSGPRPAASARRDARQRDPRQLRRLLAYARPYRLPFVLGVLATLISSGLGLVFPRLFGTLIDASFLKVGSTDTGPLDRTVLSLLGIFALSACFGAAQAYLLARVGAGVVADLRRALFSHLLSLSPRFFGNHRTGDLTSRLTSDVGTVQAVTSTALAQLASQGFTLIGSVLLLVQTSPRLSLLTLAIIPLVIGTAVTIGRRIRRVSREVQDAVAAANGQAEEAISGVRVVQSFTAEGLEEERYGQGVLASFRAEGRVRFVDVGFTYAGAPALQDITFDVPAGQVVALVGPSGAGKTTLVNLIPRFWDVTAGRVEVDGHDVRAYALADLRRQVGLVPQETLLFSGTVAENILYGRPGASQAEVEAAAHAAHAHEFICELEGGYGAVVGERGVKLSGGQRQRVAIARAILKDPRILILDEATSALDNESEALVQAALERLMVGRTTFVVAHRLSTIRSADRILVMDAGRVVADGTHEGLMAAGGLYRELYELQFRQQQEARR